MRQFTIYSKQYGPSLSVSEASLFLDLDGSIVPCGADSGKVRASTPRRIVLRRALDHLGGRLAVVSGRTVRAVDEGLGGLIHCIAGIHGLQHRSMKDGLIAEPAHARISEATEALTAFARKWPGLRIEDKGSSVAVHFRGAPEAADATIAKVESLSRSTGLPFQHGKMVAELRSPGPDKGDAVDRFMGEAPFAGSRPLFIGDDQTDEAGFVAARHHGGVGILIGEPRATRAQGRLASPVAALAWIMRSLDKGRFNFREAGWAG